MLAVALGMGLMSVFCACGNGESEGNAMETIGSESAEANIGYQSDYDDVHEMFDSQEEIPETHSLLGLRLGNRYFVDIWDQEPYERIKEYGKNILLIHGDRDSIVPISYSDKLAETIDYVEYHVIRGADHGYLGEDFDLAVSYIRDF